MFVWVMLAVLGFSALGILVNIYEVGWTLWYMRRWPVDILLMLMAAALGIFLGLTYLG